MNDKVSVIIPVYNTEAYLGACLESVCNQIYRNIEIILVDDGSTDNSGRICDSFQEKDKRIKVYHTSNGGVSAARNIALLHVTGLYVMFCDSDDTVSSNWVSDMMAVQAEGDYVMVTFPPRAEDVPGPCACKYYDVQSWYSFFTDTGIGTVWNKLFNAHIIKTHKVKFEEGLSYGEDKLFVWDYLTACDRPFYIASITNKRLYYHNDHIATSLSNQYDKNRTTFMDLERPRILQFGQRYNIPPEEISKYQRVKDNVFMIEQIGGIIMNDDFFTAYRRVKKIVSAEEFGKICRDPEVARFVSGRYLAVLGKKSPLLILLYFKASDLKSMLHTLWYHAAKH